MPSFNDVSVAQWEWKHLSGSKAKREKNLNLLVSVRERCSAVDQFKYVDGEGPFSVSLPHCCASVHQVDTLFKVMFHLTRTTFGKKCCHCALQMEENETLRRAHDKRRERLCLIQANYKTVRDQLKEMEKSNGLWVHGFTHNTLGKMWTNKYCTFTQCTGPVDVHTVDS